MPEGYVTSECLETAIKRQLGTANHLLNIWFTLKQMGLAPAHSVDIDTGNSTSALNRLFAYHEPEGKFFFPFAKTPRFMTAGSEMSRSIVQTTIVRWAEPASRGVKGVDPSSFLDFSRNENSSIRVKLGRSYPVGLGFAESGFASTDAERVAIPDVAFALWYFREEKITDDRTALVARLSSELNLSAAEASAIFVTDEITPIKLSRRVLDGPSIFRLVEKIIGAGQAPDRPIMAETFAAHANRIKSMTTIPDGPKWLVFDPESALRAEVKSGAKAVLLYGPPRTGKTRLVDRLVARDDKSRATIQIHDGWGYEELMLAFRPDGSGKWTWVPGALLQAIRTGKKVVVLEEINRTAFVQAVGEVFLLLENQYRGPKFQVSLRDGSFFNIPEDLIFIFTMNNLDKSTERLDDALLGRMSAIEVSPRVEELESMLKHSGFAEASREKIRKLFSFILSFYPLGHGYFAELTKDGDVIRHYLSSIRPVLQGHMKGFRDAELSQIDAKVDELFGA